MLKAEAGHVLVFVTLSMLGFVTFPAAAAEIMSCKIAGKGTIGSDRAHGYSLYGESDHERKFLSLQKTKTLIFENRERINFGGFNFERMRSSVGWHEVYENGYLGFAQLYDYRQEEGAATLFVFSPNGYNSQKSNFVEVELWHCNR